MSSNAKKHEKLQSRGEQDDELSDGEEFEKERTKKRLGPYSGKETGGSASSRDVSPNTPRGEEV
jgi:hypothetical protein